MNKSAFLIGAVALTLLSSVEPAIADVKFPPVYSIVGAWEVQTTVRANAADCTTAPLNPALPNPFPALHTFHLGGTVSETGSRSPPSARGPGTGVWTRTGRDTFTSRVKFQQFDANGFLVRNMDGTNEFKLSGGGNALTGISRFTFTDLSGNVLRFCATMEGTRITL
jgi:hypothetical protein